MQETKQAVANTKKIAVTVAKKGKQVCSRLCPHCGHSSPIFNEQEQHNFAPTIDANGDMQSICMDCKMKEVKKAWLK